MSGRQAKQLGKAESLLREVNYLSQGKQLPAAGFLSAAISRRVPARACTATSACLPLSFGSSRRAEGEPGEGERCEEETCAS